MDLPCGLFSDDASWAAFARRIGVRTIGGGRLYWRPSGINLDEPDLVLVDRKLDAFTRYVARVKHRFSEQPEEFRDQLRAGAAGWILGALPYLGGGPSLPARLRFRVFMLRFAPERWNAGSGCSNVRSMFGGRCAAKAAEPRRLHDILASPQRMRGRRCPSRRTKTSAYRQVAVDR